MPPDGFEKYFSLTCIGLNIFLSVIIVVVGSQAVSASDSFTVIHEVRTYRYALWTSVVSSGSFFVNNLVSHFPTIAWQIKTHELCCKIIVPAIILLPNIVLVCLHIDLKPTTAFTILVCQMIWCTNTIFASIHGLFDFNGLTTELLPNHWKQFDLSVRWVPKVSVCVANTLSYAIWWSTRLFPGHSNQLSQIAAVALHVYCFLVLTIVACRQHISFKLSMYEWKLKWIANNTNISHNDILKGFTFIILVLLNWVIFWTWNHQHASVRLLGVPELEAYINVLAFVPVAINVMISWPARDTPSVPVAKSATKLHTAFVRFVSHELLSHLSHLSLGLQTIVDDESADIAKSLVKITRLNELQESCGMSMQVLTDIAMLELLQGRAPTAQCPVDIATVFASFVQDGDLQVKNQWDFLVFLFSTECVEYMLDIL